MKKNNNNKTQSRKRRLTVKQMYETTTKIYNYNDVRARAQSPRVECANPTRQRQSKTPIEE